MNYRKMDITNKSILPYPLALEDNFTDNYMNERLGLYAGSSPATSRGENVALT